MGANYYHEASIISFRLLYYEFRALGVFVGYNQDVIIGSVTEYGYASIVRNYAVISYIIMCLCCEIIKILKKQLLVYGI